MVPAPAGHYSGKIGFIDLWLLSPPLRGGSVVRENSIYRARLYMGTVDLCREPLAVAHHGRARQSSGTRPCDYCRRVLSVSGPVGQYSWKIRFVEKPEVEDEGGGAPCG